MHLLDIVIWPLAIFFSVLVIARAINTGTFIVIKRTKE